MVQVKLTGIADPIVNPVEHSTVIRGVPEPLLSNDFTIVVLIAIYVSSGSCRGSSATSLGPHIPFTFVLCPDLLALPFRQRLRPEMLRFA